jgi:hypothetical protein
MRAIRPLLNMRRRLKVTFLNGMSLKTACQAKLRHFCIYV